MDFAYAWHKGSGRCIPDPVYVLRAILLGRAEADVPLVGTDEPVRRTGMPLDELTEGEIPLRLAVVEARWKP
jgi:hypothetical protein